MDEFPVRLKRLREEEGIPPCVLSELCGLNRNSISRYERGEAEPVKSSLKKIADHFSVSVDYLIGRTDVRTVNK